MRRKEDVKKEIVNEVNNWLDYFSMFDKEMAKLRDVKNTYVYRLQSENKKLKRNREKFKQWLIDYRYERTGSHEDGRYLISISVTDLLNKIEELDNE